VPEIVQSLLEEYGLIIILAAIVLDGLGIPAPGQSLLVAGAVLSARGDFDIRLFLMLSWIAALTGSMLGYTIGRVGGRKLLIRLPINPSRVRRMETFCQRYGALLVILSRFIDGPRQLTGIFVGSLKMPVIAFSLATGFGAVLWIGVWGLGSYYLGQHMHLVAQAYNSITPYTWVATGLLVLALCIYLIRRHNHRKIRSGKH